MENAIARKIAKKISASHDASVMDGYVYFQNGDQYIVIDIVMDKYSSKEEPSFYVNCGVQTVEILRFLGDRVPRMFSWRIQAADKNGDPQWKKEEYESIDDTVDRVVHALTNDILPELMVIDDDWLIDFWSSGSAQGISELQRLEFLTILLRSKGRREECEQVCQQMIEFAKKRPNIRWVPGHIKKVLTR